MIDRDGCVLRVHGLCLVLADQNLFYIPQERKNVAGTEDVAEASLTVEWVRPSRERMIDHEATPGGRPPGFVIGEVEVVEVR